MVRRLDGSVLESRSDDTVINPDSSHSGSRSLKGCVADRQLLPYKACPVRREDTASALRLHLSMKAAIRIASLRKALPKASRRAV